MKGSMSSKLFLIPPEDEMLYEILIGIGLVFVTAPTPQW